MQKYLKICEQDEEEDEEDKKRIAERIGDYPNEYVCKNFLSLIFENETFSPKFTHQLFPEERHCGYKDLSVQVTFNKTWKAIQISETNNGEYTKTEGSVTEILKTNECTKPLFEDYSNEDKILSSLPGRLIWENEDFSINWVDEVNSDEIAKIIINRGHGLSLFYIERASQVDTMDSRWRLMVLYSKKSNSLAGFTSIYEFRNPIKDTISLRICVMFLVPKYQRKRLGDIMLRTVYREATSSLDNIVEITVEDPNENFTKMRRRVELDCFQRIFQSKFSKIELFEQIQILPEEMYQELQKETKFTKNALQYCFECCWLKILQELKVDEESTPQKGKFRLSIKGRLRKELMNLPDPKSHPEQFKEVLQEEYVLVLNYLKETIQDVEKNKVNYIEE